MTSATIKASSHTGGHHTPAVVVTRNCNSPVWTNLAHHPAQDEGTPAGADDPGGVTVRVKDRPHRRPNVPAALLPRVSRLGHPFPTAAARCARTGRCQRDSPLTSPALAPASNRRVLRRR